MLLELFPWHWRYVNGVASIGIVAASVALLGLEIAFVVNLVKARGEIKEIAQAKKKKGRCLR